VTGAAASPTANDWQWLAAVDAVLAAGQSSATARHSSQAADGVFGQMDAATLLKLTC
jgi:hypothetical protein